MRQVRLYEESWPDWMPRESGVSVASLVLDRHRQLRDWRARYPYGDLWEIETFQRLISAAENYFRHSGCHLHGQVYGQIGELYASIRLGVRRHRSNYVPGSDGRSGKDWIEIKTITPEKTMDSVKVSLKGNFSRLVVVKIGPEFFVELRTIARKELDPKGKKKLTVRWSDLPPLS